MSVIRCVLADDSASTLQGLAAVLSADGIDVVGRARTTGDLDALLDALRPQVSLVGFADLLVLQVARRHPGVAMVWLSEGLASPRVLSDALEAGIRAVVPKSAPVAVVLDAARASSAGQLLYRGAWQPVVVDLRDPPAPRAPIDEPRLTDREHELVQLVVDGMTNRQAAHALGIAEQTTKNHLRLLFVKAGVANRSQLAVWAMQQGFRAGAVSRPGGPPAHGGGR